MNHVYIRMIKMHKLEREEIITALCFSIDAERLKNMSTWENENIVQLLAGD